MDIAAYRKRRAEVAQEGPRRRELCFTCVQPQITCYCKHVQRFDPKIDFIVLIHPIEMRRRVATGRMSHLTLENSRLIQGHDYSRNASVNDIVNDTSRHCVVLYPGPTSKDLTSLNRNERAELFPNDKKLTVFVLDGTWITAKQMMKLSANLRGLPRICFTPPAPSNFRVRKQPHEGCYSTIEAIHHTIELLGDTRDFDVAAREHDKLLHVFDKMVSLQLEFVERSHALKLPSRYRKNREKRRA